MARRTARASADVVLDLMERARLGGYKFRVCGIGSTDNKGTKPKDVICTEIDLVESTKCKKYGTTADLHTVPEGLACFQWSDRDNNVCVGDYGGPIYMHRIDEDGDLDETLYFIAVGSPDVRENSLCQGGHTVFAQIILFENLGKWRAELYKRNELI